MSLFARFSTGSWTSFRWSGTIYPGNGVAASSRPKYRALGGAHARSAMVVFHSHGAAWKKMVLSDHPEKSDSREGRPSLCPDNDIISSHGEGQSKNF